MPCTCATGADMVSRILQRLALDPDPRYRDDSKARYEHTCAVHGTVVFIAWRRSATVEDRDPGTTEGWG